MKKFAIIIALGIYSGTFAAVAADDTNSPAPKPTIPNANSPSGAHNNVISSNAIQNPMLLKLDDKTQDALQDLTEDKWFKKDNLFSTVLGAALAVLGGLVAIGLQARQKKQEDAEFRANVLSAIRRELEALNGIYTQGIGVEVGKLTEGQILRTRLALTQDWFTVFTANAVNLGRFEADISRRIITVYALLKALIEEFKINNDLLDLGGLSSTELLQKIGTNQDGCTSRLTKQAARIRQTEAALKASTDELFKLLDERGIK